MPYRPRRWDRRGNGSSRRSSEVHIREDGPDVLYVAMNMYWEALAFELLSPPPGQRWHVCVNTAMAPPEDIWEPGQESPLSEPEGVLLGGRAILVLVER
jgi:isoamylase